MSKTISGTDFEADVRINRFKLDEECEIQPALYSFYSTQQVEAKAEYDSAKANLELVQAQRELHYRRNPPDDVKITDATTKALVTADTEVQKAQERLSIASKALNVLNGALASLDQRRSALNNLVELFTKDYYNNNGKQEEASVPLTNRRRNKE